MFPGIGTVVNAAAVVLGGLAGVFFGRLMKERIRENIIKADGVAVIFFGISGTLSYMLKQNEDGTFSTYGALMLVVCLALGTLIGELLDVEKGFEKLGEGLKKHFAKDDRNFVSAFMDTSLVICIGAMAIVGSIQDGLAGDPSTLFAKSVMDFITVMMMAGALGVGCIFSFIPIVVIQGGITLLSGLAEPILNVGTVISDMSLVGNAMIACVGINLAFGKKFRVGNMVPGLVIAVIWSLVSYNLG